MTEAKPFYSLEVEVAADLEEITNGAEAEAWTESFMDDLQEVIKLHTKGTTVHVSCKLNHEILEYEWFDGVDRSQDQQEAADNFVERVRKAQEVINTEGKAEMHAGPTGNVALIDD